MAAVKCPVCKRPVPVQWQEGYWGRPVAAAHPAKKGKGICDGSGKPARNR